MTSTDCAATTVLEIGDPDDLVRLVDRLAASPVPILLTRDDRQVAVLSPVGEPVVPDFGPPAALPEKHMRDEDRAAFHAAPGGWQDFDADALLEHILAARDAESRPLDDV